MSLLSCPPYSAWLRILQAFLQYYRNENMGLLTQSRPRRSAVLSPFDRRARWTVMEATLNILLYVMLAAVAVVLGFGIYALFRGGDFGRSWSNRLMRLRVLFQFIAVLVVVAIFWLRDVWSS